MSMEVLKEFLIAIGVKVNTGELAAVDAAVDKTAISAAKLDASATAASATLSNRLAPAIGALLSPLTLVTAAIGEAYHAMFGFIEKSAEGLDDVAKLSNRVNASAESILKLGYIAQVSGSSVEAARSSLDGLNKAAGEAALGVGRSKKIFNEIGLSVKDANGHLKDTGTLIFEVGEKIKGMERGKQLAVLEKLRIDPTLIESLTTNVSGLEQEFDKLYKAANLDPKKAAESAEKFNDTLDKLHLTFQVIKDSVASSFFDTFTDGFDAFRQQIVNNLPRIIDTIKPVVAMLVKIGEIALKLGVVFGTVAGTIISVIQKINDATGGWAVKIAAVTFAWKKLNLAFLRSPIGIIVELATAFALLYDDYKTWEKGGQSFINWGNKSGIIITNVIGDLSLLTAGFYLFKIGVEAGRKALMAYRAALIIFEATAIKARQAVQLLSTAMEFGFVGAYATLGLMIADVVLLIQKIKELKSLFNELNETKSGTEQRSSVVKKHGGILSFIPGGVLAASLYNPASTKLTPSPATAGTIANNKHITVTQKTDIHVHGSGNPYETATAVQNVQRQNNADQLRNMQGAVQ